MRIDFLLPVMVVLIHITPKGEKENERKRKSNNGDYKDVQNADQRGKKASDGLCSRTQSRTGEGNEMNETDNKKTIDEELYQMWKEHPEIRSQMIAIAEELLAKQQNGN